jgi:type IV pilus assembly protein PilY1
VDEGTDAYDDDGDGYTEDGGDCDDTDALVGPHVLETTGDGVDNDCDGVTR